MTAYLDAWQHRTEAPGAFTTTGQAFLKLYSQAYAQATAGPAQPNDDQLRLLFDLAGLAHTTTISPPLIRQAVGSPPPQRATSSDKHQAPPPGLPDRVAHLLRAVVMAEPDRGTFMDAVARETRRVVLTDRLVEWSPACPLDVCGTSEPLTRTVILTSASYAELTPKPDWSMAAVAVHEATHIGWFHSNAVADDPRLLLPLVNERLAWRETAKFLRGLLRSPAPELRPYIHTHGQAIRQMLQQARQQVRGANATLGLPKDDESTLLVLPDGISESALRGYQP